MVKEEQARALRENQQRTQEAIRRREEIRKQREMMREEREAKQRRTNAPPKTVEQAKQREVLSFRLLVGMHQGPDIDQEPQEITDEKGVVIGVRYPTRTWIANDAAGYRPIVRSHIDLVDKFGENKFEYMGDPVMRGRSGVKSRTPGDPTAENLRESPAVAPSGVTTGHPSTEGREGSRDIAKQQQEEEGQKMEEEKQQEQDEEQQESQEGGESGHEETAEEPEGSSQQGKPKPPVRVRRRPGQ